MKRILYIISVVLIIVLIQQDLHAQHLYVEGHVKIRGNIDINHPEDTTSIFIGRNAGASMDFSSRMFNTFVGTNSGRHNTTGDANSFFGTQSGTNNTIGGSNSFFGQSAGFLNTTGFENSFFGANSGINNKTGTRNTFIGTNAGFSNNTGSSNSFFGQSAGFLNTTGIRNTFIGFESGQLSSLDSLNRSIAIGYKSKVDCSRCAVIGEAGADAVKLGLGTTTPQYYLTLTGTNDRFVPDFAITSRDALIELGSGKGGPHGLILGDQNPGEGMKLLYRADPNELIIEPGNEASDNTTGLFRFALNGAMYALDLNDIGNKKTMQYNTVTGEIGYDNSSRRYKINIKALNDDWSKILKTRPVSYNRPASPDYMEYGYIAEEMDSIGLTALVGYDAEGLPDDVKYDRMVLYLTEIVKIQQTDVQLLQEELSNLKDSHLEIQGLKSEITFLKKALLNLSSKHASLEEISSFTSK